MKTPLTVLFFAIGLSATGQAVRLSVERVWAERVSATAYHLHQTQPRPARVYQGPGPDQIDWRGSFLTLTDSVVVAVAPHERRFFGVVEGRDTLIFSERRLWVENAPNFRDLGGLPTHDGRRVRWGKLFRCGDMSTLTEADLTTLRNAAIRSVVDLRNEQEVTQNPDAYPAGYEIRRVWSSITPANGESMKQFYALMGKPDATAAEAEAVFEEFYGQMPRYVKNYAPLFETLLRADGATLFHCTAGKDRTGLGSALILSALGVPEETIVEEYALSNRYTQYLAASDRMRHLNPEVAGVLAGVAPRYIRASLNRMKQQYGSVRQCLETELGLDAAKLAALRAAYTH